MLSPAHDREGTEVSKFEWLKLVHVVAAIVWVGGAAMTSLYGMRMANTASREERIAFTKQTLFAGTVFSIASLILLGFGTWMVIDNPVWDFDQLWVTLGFIGIVVGAALGMGFYAPQGKKLIAELEAGDPAAEARGRRLGMVGVLETLLLLVVVWSMIAKPGL
jgi:uncharacterized membrane protein